MSAAAIPNTKERVMSGMRPTGPLHIGHYFGVLRNWIELQDKYTCFFGAMDWHAQMDKYKTPSEVDIYIKDNLAEWIAWGLDPEKCTLYVQSQVPETLELSMIFSVLTPMGWLERVATWKDGIEEMKQKDTHTLGRFSYPVLQTADIAIVGAALIPIGKDNVSHLEAAREIVRRFNSLYKAHLPEPRPLLTPHAALVGTDGRKMSSSYDNFLPLSEDSKLLEKRIKKMPTDPARIRREDIGNPEVCPVYGYHKLFSKEEDLKWVVQGCTTAGIGCGDCKARLFSNINSLYEKPRETKKELLHNPKRLDAIILEGSQKVREEAQKTLKNVRSAMKFFGGV